MTRPELITLVKDIALIYNLDAAMVCAIVDKESAFDTYAIRCESESGFMKRYGGTYTQLVKNSATKIDDKWFQFEDIFYSSYGLMQVMYPVAIETFPELASALTYPTRLCDPQVGLMAGCRLLAKKLGQAGGDVQKALLFWNGGSDTQYPFDVMSRKVKFA